MTDHPATLHDFGLLRAPDEILFGVGTLAALPRSVQALGSRVFLCADPFIATLEPFARSVAALEQLGLAVRVSTAITPELPVALVEEIGDDARAFAPDVVVGFGGGSALDTAKLVALLVAHRGEPLSAYYGENRVPKGVLPIVAVPTTAGTGSEVTPVAVVSDPDRELKVGVSSPQLIPRTAIVDPRLTLGAPASVAAYSGIDAFVHAVESFTAAQRQPDWASELPVFMGRNRLSSLLALEAVRTIGANLRTAVADPHDLPSHEAMAYGSLLAGLAFGTGGTHLSHALQYPVGALSKTPHGLGTGMLFPFVLRACAAKTTAELGQLAGALGVGADAASAEARADAAIEAVASLVIDIGVPGSLAEIGIEAAQLPHIAELALTVSRLANNSTIEATQESLEAILTAASIARYDQ